MCYPRLVQRSTTCFYVKEPTHTMLLFHFKTLDSTHMWMKSHFAEISDTRSYHSAICAAVTSEKQTNGKGRLSSTYWHSFPGSLSSSFLVPICDQLPRGQWGILPIMAAHSLLSTITMYCAQQYKDHLYIKWPNDVFYNNHKIGISTVEIIDSHYENSFAIISINANIADNNIIPELINFDFATVGQLSGKKINPEKFFMDLSKQISHDLKLLFSRKEDVFIQECKKWTCKRQKVQFQYEEQESCGFPMDVLSNGSLVLHTEQKQQIVINSNEAFSTYRKLEKHPHCYKKENVS